MPLHCRYRHWPIGPSISPCGKKRRAVQTIYRLLHFLSQSSLRSRFFSSISPKMRLVPSVSEVCAEEIWQPFGSILALLLHSDFSSDTSALHPLLYLSRPTCL